MACKVVGQRKRVEARYVVAPVLKPEDLDIVRLPWPFAKRSSYTRDNKPSFLQTKFENCYRK